MEKTRKHIFIPDCQVKPGVPTEHLEWIGNYIVEKEPDVVVNAGDFADMESLSSYDKGKLQFEGRRYTEDTKASQMGIFKLLAPIKARQETQRRWKEKIYRPELVLTLGNHENRITRACEEKPEYDGLLSIDHLGYDDFEVIPFTEIKVIDGLAYSHYFYNPTTSRPYGGQSIDTRLKNIGFSFVMGHQQVYMVGTRTLNNGKRLRGLVCGHCYLHNESYRGPQSNGEYRGIFVFHEVKNGDYNLMEVSLDYLCRRYEGVPLWKFIKTKYPKLFASSTWLNRLEQL